MEKLNIAEPSSSFKRKPVVIIVVGMAGTLVLYLTKCNFGFNIQSVLLSEYLWRDSEYNREWKNYISSPPS